MRKTVELSSDYRRKWWIPIWWRMKRRCKLSQHKFNIHQPNINKICILNPNINKINTHNNHSTLDQRGVEIFEVEDNNKEEEDLVMEEAKSYVTIVENHDIFLGTVRTLQRHVRILNPLIILLNSVHNWLWCDMLKLWEIQTLAKSQSKSQPKNIDDFCWAERSKYCCCRD